jgi:uncharacterized protein
MNETSVIVEQTTKWIRDVVIGLNFCPFAARELKQGTVHYELCAEKDPKKVLAAFLYECERLDKNPAIETTFLIFPDSFPRFDNYLDLLAMAQELIVQKKYEGIYQVASFHPHYCFADAPQDDAANYTNRSPYPMLHLLREESIEKVLEKYPDPDQIPERNVKFAREKGEAYMKMLRDACL